MEEYDRYFCGDCVYYSLPKNGKPSRCKRIDHDVIKFSKPYFECYDGNQYNGILCSDFYPSNHMKYARAHWPGFDLYWEYYVKEILPYGNTNTYVWFCLNGDTSIRYGVPLLDFVFGTMVEEGRLRAVKKMYYKRNRRAPTRYILVTEEIDGVETGGATPPEEDET